MTERIETVADTILYSGKLIDVVSRTLRVVKSDSKPFEYSIEVARRPPGVRLIVLRDSRYLLLKEYRAELQGWDYRLAGGKVFESQEHHLAFLQTSAPIAERLAYTVSAEAKEELGIVVKASHFMRKSSAGATVDWDLYFFMIDGFEELESGPQPEGTELLTSEWHDADSVVHLIQSHQFSEDRSIGVLLQEMLRRGDLLASKPKSAA